MWVGVLVVERGRGAFSWRVAVASVAEGSLFDELRVEMNSARARTTPVTNEFMAPAYGSGVEQWLSTEHPWDASYAQGLLSDVTVNVCGCHSGCVR